MRQLPDLSVWVPVLWDNANNKDVVIVDNVRHEFRRFTFNTQEFEGWRFPWAKLEDVRNALA